MRRNNYYYKLIAQLLDEEIDDNVHTDLYYTKKIAESYGNTYEDIGNINKYLRDFAEEVGVELEDKHYTNKYYLREIAKILSEDDLEHDTINYYLQVILDYFDGANEEEEVK